MVVILGTTPDRMPLKYMCPFKLNNTDIDTYLIISNNVFQKKARDFSN